MKKKISAGTLTRTAVLGLALTNQLLSAAGKPLLPIDNAQLEQMISTGFTVGAALAPADPARRERRRAQRPLYGLRGGGLQRAVG